MTHAFSADDVRFMQLALRLARRAQGNVEPNPMVGAVVVRNSKIAGQGYHHRFGGPHAEVHALADAGPRARASTLYVTLEPCCHFGKTPPCTDAILAAGIKCVVVAMIDPFARVRGRGVSLLRKHGLRVEVGLLEDEARVLNAPFITRIKHHRPYVIAKWAQSLDGCVATASGESKWISSDTSREFVQKLRGRMDAIVIGIGTALTDDPLLMARPPRAANIHRVATRIVVDSQCRLPLDSQLVRTVPFAPVLVAHAKSTNRATERRRQALAGRGVMTLALPADSAGHVRIAPLLKYLAKQDYTNILVEGGPSLMSAFVRQNLVDEAHVFIAPIIIGGKNAHHAIAGPDLSRLADATHLHLESLTPSGPDAHLHLAR